MDARPSQDEKARISEQIGRVIGELPSRLRNVLQAAREGGAAVGAAGAGGAGSLAALYFAGINGLSAAGITSGLATVGGIVGGGMVAGVGGLAVPIAAGGLAGYVAVARRRRAKDMAALNTAIEKLKNIQEQLVENAEYYRDELAVLRTYIESLENELHQSRETKSKDMLRFIGIRSERRDSQGTGTDGT
ncbi:MAG: hypothetical protein OXF11_04465 [Deltaproteobacteria bacterium]|nr:hypothetical protein [Deltaproteobacteria bacterium]